MNIEMTLVRRREPGGPHLLFWYQSLFDAGRVPAYFAGVRS